MKRFTLLLLMLISFFSFSRAQHFNPVWSGNALDAHNFYFFAASINGVTLEDGDEIGIFDGSDCVGAATVVGTFSAGLEVRCSADDPTTVGVIDGYTAGHTPTYRIWDSGTSTEIPNGNITITAAGTNFAASSSTYVTFFDGFMIVYEPEIDVSPSSSVDFGDVVVGSSTDQTVTVSNSGNADLHVTSTDLTGTGFSILSGGGAMTIAPAASQDIVIRFTAGSTGAAAGSLSMPNDDSDENPYVLTLSATGTVPDIASTPTSIDYGDINIGTYSDETITVSNEGTADLVISSKSITGSDRFTIQSGGGGATITPGSTEDVVVRFTPTLMGAVSASLDIASNDPDHSTYSIPLAGSGILVEGNLAPGSHDFGGILTGSSSSTSFVISNTGTEDLVVSSVGVSGEFAVTSSTGPFTISSGGNSTVNVDFNPISAGAKSGTLTVASNDPDGSYTASLSGEGTGPGIIAAPNPAAYGDVLVGGNSDITIVVTNNGTADLNITSTDIAPAGIFTIQSGGGAATVAPAATRNIVVRFSPTALGAASANLSIADDFNTSAYEVPLSGTGVLPDIAASPTSVNFGDVSVGSNSDITVVVSNEGTADLVISSKSIAPAGPFTIQSGGGGATITPGSSQDVVVRFSPSAMGAALANLSIASNDPNENPLVIPLSGNGALIDGNIAPSSHDYGNVLAGTSASTSFILTNTGNVDLVVSSVGVTGEFAVTSSTGPFTVGVGSTATINVGFNPLSVGAKSGTLTIASNDPDSPYTASLTGNGTGPGIIAAPNPAAFGDVLLGDDLDIPIVVTNNGTADLNITSTDISPAGIFTIQSGGGVATVTAGNTREIVVRFSPAALGAASANLSIADDFNPSPYVVPLSGTGVAPEILVAPDPVAFGNVTVDESSDISVVVSNTGSADLHVTSTVIAGAGYSILSGGGAVTIAPAGTQDIVVRFTPGSAGALAGTLTIANDDSDESSYVLALSGTGTEPDISAAPNPADYGDVVLGQTSDITVVVSNSGLGNLNITSTSISGDFTILSGGGIATVAPGTTRPIVVQFSPTAVGVANSNLVIASNDPDAATYNVALTGTGVEPDIASDPTSLDYGPIDVGTNSDETVEISNEGTADLIISTTNISPAGIFTILSGGGAATIAPGGSENIVVRFSPTAIGAVSASLDIASNDPDESTYSIPLDGIGLAPDISASPNPVYYGDLLVDNTSNATITIANDGTADLLITATSISGEFNIQSGSGAQTIVPGATSDIVVQFAPTSRGVKSANLSIASNDPNQATYNVELYGTGIAPEITVSPASWNAGDVVINTTSSRTFNVSNTGDATLNVTASSISGDTDFSIASGGGAFSLAPSASHSIGVDFYSTSLGAKSATLSIASDAINIDPITVSLTGNTIPENTAPEVTVPGETIDEGSTFAIIYLDDFVTDDNTLDENISWGYSGNSELGVSIVNRVCTISIPNENWFGSETIFFSATDEGGLIDTDDANFTVNPVNDAPVVGDIPNQTQPDGAPFDPINLNDWVADVETADANISWEVYNESTGLATEFFDISISAGIATIVPKSATWEGSETVVFEATDDDGTNPLSDSDPVTLTVNATIDPPVVSDIPDQTIDEGASFATISLDDYVSDSETADADIVWTYGGNTELTVVIAGRVATISAPDAEWSGSETITFTATDDDPVATSSDSDAATFTINPVNDKPVIDDQNPMTVAEDDTLNITLSHLVVSDIDNVPGELSVRILPGTDYSVLVDDNLIPALNFNGTLSVNLVVNDGSDDSDPFIATVTVTPVNDAPVVSGIADQTITNGESFVTVSLDDYVEDVETVDANIIWSFAGNSELLVTITDRVATITAPTAEWLGSESITFTATDDDATNPLSGDDTAEFTVTCVNSAPVVDDIPDQSIVQGETFDAIALGDYVSDPETADEDIVWVATGNTDLSVAITDGVATVSAPNADWTGSETITFTATDNALCELSDANEAVFTVTKKPDALNLYLSDVEISVYPNPTKGMVFISFSDQINSKVEIRLTNALGQIVDIRTFQGIEETVELDLNNLSTGIYHVSIISDDQNQGFPVILK